MIGLDLVPERLARARRARRRRRIDVSGADDVAGAVRELTGGRGPDARDRRRRHGGARRADRQARPRRWPACCPTRVARKADARRPASTGLPRCTLAIELVRRGGTISLSGVYGGAADPLNMLQMFDKQLTLRMGQANVRRWIDDILPLLERRRRPARRRRRSPPTTSR